MIAVDNEDLIEWVAELKDRVLVLEREIADIKGRIRRADDRDWLVGTIYEWAEK